MTSEGLGIGCGGATQYKCFEHGDKVKMNCKIVQNISDDVGGVAGKVVGPTIF